MNCYVTNDEFLRMFLENGGPQTFVNTIKVTNDETTLRNIIVFIHTVIAHKDICKKFLKERLYAA